MWVFLLKHIPAEEQVELEEEKKTLLNRDERRQLTIRDLQDKVDGYQELLLIKDEEIKQLTQINQELLEENSGLKVETAALNRSIDEISREREQLNEKIELVSQLKVESMQISAVSPRAGSVLKNSETGTSTNSRYSLMSQKIR